MGKIINKHIIKIKELISDEVCMGIYGLVELELLEMEKDLLNAPKQITHNIDYEASPKSCRTCINKCNLITQQSCKNNEYYMWEEA